MTVRLLNYDKPKITVDTVYADDVLTFSPFHCLAEHRPLGSVMRARKQAYDDSSGYRHEMNAVKRVEPGSIGELPD